MGEGGEVKAAPEMAPERDARRSGGWLNATALRVSRDTSKASMERLARPPISSINKQQGSGEEEEEARRGRGCNWSVIGLNPGC